MDIENYINEAIFGEVEKHKCFYELMWERFKECGFIIVDEEGYEIDAIVKATAIKNILGEFVYRLYDEVNETGFEDVIEYTETLGYTEEDLFNYCKGDKSAENDFGFIVKNTLDHITEITADKMLEEFSADDIFDYLFTATYDFEQDFIFDFEDYDEMLAFVDTHQEQLDNYKDEYDSVMNWIKSGLLC